MNWKIYRIIFILIFFCALSDSLVVPLLPPYANTLGATSFHIGLIFGAAPFAICVLVSYIGRVSDVRGRKPFVILGFIGFCIISAAFAFFANVHALILIRFFQGISFAMVLPVLEAYSGDIAPKGKEGLVMGLFSVTFMIGVCAGPVLGGAIKDTFGIQVSFFMMGLVCALGVLTGFLFLPPVKKEPASGKSLSSVSFKRLLADRRIAGVFLFRLAYFISLGIVWTFAPLLADTEYNLSGLDTGFIITLGVIASAVFMVPMGILADKMSKRILVVIGGLVTACGMFFFAGVRDAWQLYAVSVLIGIGDGISIPTVTSMTMIMGRKHEAMGSVISLMTLGDTLGLVTGPVLAGLFIDRMGMPVTFGGSGVFMLLAAGAAMILTSGFQSFETEL
ncbi:MAG: MFS transporter [Desulfobacteraceae bacterium]|nr:MFS transporter [Desulfobacteraceae bacterium]